MNMKCRTFRDKLFYGSLLFVCGCGVSSPVQPTPSQQTVAPEKSAEVAESFTDFDAAVVAEAPNTNSATQEASKAPAQTAAATAPRTTELKSDIPVPTADQLKAWESPAFERLQLLACRDGGKAGIVTRAVTLNNGDGYALAGSRLTAWSLEKDEPLVDFSDSANEQFIRSLAVSPDGKWLATGDSKGNLQIWDLPSCTQRIAKKIYPSGVAHLSISTDSQTVATAAFTGEVTLWDTAEWTVKKKVTVSNQLLQSIRFIAPNRIAVASQDAAIWNTDTGKQEQQLTTGGYFGTFALTPDGKRLAYGNDGKIEFWNIAENKRDGEIRGGFSGSDLAAFSPDGKLLVTASKFLVQIWDVASGRAVQVIDTFGWETTSLNWLANPNVLMIASANGRVRFWGTTGNSAAAKLGWKPLHAPLPAITAEPASPAQLLELLDLRMLPTLPGANVMATNESMVMYNTSVPIDEAKVFYNFALTKAGWKRVEEGITAPDALNYSKQGITLGIYLSKSPEGNTQVNLNTSGNVDLRKLPKFGSQPSKVVYEAENVVQYQVGAALLDVETELIRKFHKAGWTSYARLNTSKLEETNSRDLQFIRGATTLRVMIQPQPTEPGAFTVGYSKFVTTKSLPIPVDAGFVEFDGSTRPMLVASTSKSLNETRDFYAKQMAAEGWLRRDSGAVFDEKSGWMDFIRGQCDVSIVLKVLDSGRTQILVGEDLENASWQLSKPKKLDDAVTSNGLEAADVPALNGWSITKYDAEQKQIDFVAKGATTFAFAEAYTKELESRGWKTDGRGVKSDEYLLADFTRDKAEITLRVTLRGGEIQASLSGDGLLWTKPLPVAKQVVAYETWLRVNRYPASLDLLDKYITEMKALQ